MIANVGGDDDDDNGDDDDDDNGDDDKASMRAKDDDDDNGSAIIESIFGKYKLFSARTPLKQMGYLLLILPLLTTSFSAQQVKLALEHCSFEQVEAWFQENFGRSALASGELLFSPPESTQK